MLHDFEILKNFFYNFIVVTIKNKKILGENIMIFKIEANLAALKNLLDELKTELVEEKPDIFIYTDPSRHISCGDPFYIFYDKEDDQNIYVFNEEGLYNYLMIDFAELQYEF